MSEISIEEEIRNSMAAAMTQEHPEDDAPEVVEDQPEAVTVEEEAPEAVEVTQEPVEVKPHDEPPVSLSAQAKAKWKELPEDVRAEWHKREKDFEKAFTRHDGELNLGRTVKEIAQPYEAIIRAEGGTVEGAFKDLLNTAYVLRTGSPQQKAHLILQTAQQFGVDLAPYMQQQGQQANPVLAMQQELQNLRQQLNPEQLKQQLREEAERDRIQSEIQAFSSDPAHIHFEAVRPIMKVLIETGKAKDLKDAYQMAIWSDPTVRATLEAEAKAQAEQKRKAELAAKKKAAASVAGSASAASPSSNAPQKSLEDELREQLAASQGKI
jgi:hypothetical protein